MSSIDKYVISEARACNPQVRVVNAGGRIRGYIGMTKVFDMADRHGYLNDTERSIIQNGIHAYEVRAEEERRREEQRLEAERVAARQALKQSMQTAQDALERSHQTALHAYREACSGLNLTEAVSGIKGYNLSGFSERARTLEARVRSGADTIESEYRSKKGELDRLRGELREDGSTQSFQQLQSQLRRTSTSVSNVTFPTAEVNRMREEITQLKNALPQLDAIQRELKQISGGLAGSMAQNAIQTLQNQSIGSLEDVSNLILQVQGQIAQIREVEFRQQTEERADRLAKLEGIARACTQLRDYVVKQEYEAFSYREEIVQTANRVMSAYNELLTAPYTTCDKNTIDNVLAWTQGTLLDAASDERTLRELEQLLDDYEIHRRNDLLQSDNYADYCRNVNELVERGMALEEISAFDPHGYEAQRRGLMQALLEQDYVEGVSRTRTTYVMACKAMEDMGYAMLHYDLGDEEKDIRDALACEAIYVIPGCEGVAWRLTVSDCDVRRELIGIVRPDGRATPVETVHEVAQKIESSGEINEYFSRYAAYSGDQLSIAGAVDSDTEGADEVIESARFQLTGEGERRFDALVATGDESARQKWSTTRRQAAVKTVTVSDKKQDDRRRAHAGYQAQKMAAKR